MADGFEPTSVRLRDVPIGREVTNGVLSLGFYVVCGVIGLLPGSVRNRAADAFVTWSESVDEQRHN
ncbi:serine/threonine protein phosphatase [Rhodococcus sp. 05-340-1]|uniref:serine/threonine protein phosphatase n=1 Tax=unclassified Rhodococcus (in: high G+C Gram-positive bacteria) TaxID=192944 RepID=UPI000B9C5AFB|nr:MULTISPECIES: serine/threonine protein phosphatase [unclassified Rhodococcus (in: high G+C Gram-positive bacteria)]OZD73626.1 serine/threonine protein phosphatase [Rhodococcus sp. 05-340-2]OZD85042.1 serine/threonine protein phosphatase [Rhodococcus sp. 05-340-1]